MRFFVTEKVNLCCAVIIGDFFYANGNEVIKNVTFHPEFRRNQVEELLYAELKSNLRLFIRFFKLCSPKIAICK